MERSRGVVPCRAARVYKADTRPGGFDLSMVVEWGSYGDKVGVGKTMSCIPVYDPRLGIVYSSL